MYWTGTLVLHRNAATGMRFTRTMTLLTCSEMRSGVCGHSGSGGKGIQRFGAGDSHKVGTQIHRKCLYFVGLHRLFPPLFSGFCPAKLSYGARPGKANPARDRRHRGDCPTRRRPLLIAASARAGFDQIACLRRRRHSHRPVRDLRISQSPLPQTAAHPSAWC